MIFAGQTYQLCLVIQRGQLYYLLAYLPHLATLHRGSCVKRCPLILVVILVLPCIRNTKTGLQRSDRLISLSI